MKLIWLNKPTGALRKVSESDRPLCPLNPNDLWETLKGECISMETVQKNGTGSISSTSKINRMYSYCCLLWNHVLSYTKLFHQSRRLSIYLGSSYGYKCKFIENLHCRIFFLGFNTHHTDFPLGYVYCYGRSTVYDDLAFNSTRNIRFNLYIFCVLYCWISRHTNICNSFTPLLCNYNVSSLWIENGMDFTFQLLLDFNCMRLIVSLYRLFGQVSSQ